MIDPVQIHKRVDHPYSSDARMLLRGSAYKMIFSALNIISTAYDVCLGVRNGFRPLARGIDDEFIALSPSSDGTTWATLRFTMGAICNHNHSVSLKSSHVLYSSTREPKAVAHGNLL